MDSLLLIGGAILLFFLVEKSAVISSLQFVPNGISYDVSNPLVPVIDLDVLVQNPTSGTLTLYSLAGSFSINGSPSGNVSYFPGAPVAIVSNGQTPITLSMRINDAQLIQDILTYVNGGGGSIVIVISATANVNNAPMPLSLTFNSAA